MYLMPVNAELQDLVCQFPHADITLLARQSQQSSSLGLCSIEGQGQELLVSHNTKFVKSNDHSFSRRKPKLFDGYRQITHEVEMRIPLSLLRTLSVESVITDVPKWGLMDLFLRDGIPPVWGIHLCDFLPGVCSCMTISKVVSRQRLGKEARLPSCFYRTTHVDR